MTKKSIKKIVNELQNLRDKYYNDPNGTNVDDKSFDKLEDKLKEIDPTNEYFNTVGSSISSNKVKIPYVLGSLNKIKPDTFDKWSKDVLKKNDIIVSHKLDGVSFMCTWENGKITFASTRGNGYEGQNITEKIKKILPDIQYSSYISLRGELLLTGDDHIKLGYKNRRNGVNGALNDHIEYLKPIFYEVLDLSGKILSTEFDRLNFIESLGLPTVSFKKVNNENINLQSLFEELSNSKGLEYNTDGLVLTINNSEREDELYPKCKVAFKVNTSSTRVTVKSVELNVGRTGKVTPTVWIEPTLIDGVTVSKATGFNIDFICNNGIDKGAEIGVVRSGGVIPFITECFKPVNTYIPENCPCCGNKLVKYGVDLYCDNDDCSSSKIKSIAHYFKVMGSNYITETTIKNLGVFSIEEMYELDEFAISNIDGFGIKKAEQVVYEIQKTLKTTPVKLLASFGISGIGETLAKPILDKYTFDELFTIDSVEDVYGVGETLSNYLISTINNYKELYDFLLEKGLTFTETKETNISGKVFTITGKLPIKRDNLIKIIISNGGVVKGISKLTDYLITDDPTSNSDKNKKAKEINEKSDKKIMIIDYNEFSNMIK